ncbi:MAG: Bax inhibitor-1/YccA family protein [Deltaproteobacteria bacterium]|nr:MAG: Bax inhibitor-1/YccA family protein [Deltaproteobacteria bacterium]
MWNTSNPALSNEERWLSQGPISDAATMSGVVNKTSFLVMIALIAGAGGYTLAFMFPSAIMISFIASLIIGLGFTFYLAGNPEASPRLAPIYAVVEGIFLGAFTAVADAYLGRAGLAVAGGVGIQALIITASCVGSMLVLYRTGILKPTRTFVAIVQTLTMAVFVTYLVSFLFSMFSSNPLPLLSPFSSASASGSSAWIGLAINGAILLLASAWLIIDFKMVEENVEAGAPKYMEWYCGFAILVTLTWIYYEAVKLVVRLAVIFGSSD